jgi:VIT1/CCC1 family predicted Fe2+/Mn2+ transporter
MATVNVRAPIILGAADGVVIVLGLVLSLAGQPHAVFHAAAGGGLAELVGMTAGMWLSDGRSPFRVAASCGVAALAACVVPALPYAAGSGAAALVMSLLLVAGVAAIVAWLRPEKGTMAVAQTYGTLLVAAALCTVVGAV